jgi:hypothetical protein
MTNPPDYFALLRQMIGAGTVANASASAQAATLFDPAEIDKKISELNTVKLWLDTQSGAITLSIQALEMQRDALRSMQSSSDVASAHAAAAPVDFSAAATLFDPANWMPQPSASASAAKRTRKAKK